MLITAKCNRIGFIWTCILWHYRAAAVCLALDNCVVYLYGNNQYLTMAFIAVYYARLWQCFYLI